MSKAKQTISAALKALADEVMASAEAREQLERAVVGALRSCIKDHGPITPQLLTSATKRVLGNLANLSG